MAKRRGDAGNPKGPDADGRQVALRVLRELKDPPVIDAATAVDRFALAEILFDRMSDCLEDRFFAAMYGLLFEPMLERARAYLLSEHFLLEPEAVAADAVARLYSGNVLGERKRPIQEWMASALRATVERNRGVPELALFKLRDDSSPDQKLAHVLGKLANQAEPTTRWICWLLWIEALPLPQIAIRTEVPLEHVEHLMSVMLQRAMTSLGYTDRPAEGPQRDPEDDEADEGEREEGADE